MPAKLKKRIRKIVDRIKGNANDLNSEMRNEDLSEDARKKIDQARDDLITAANTIAEISYGQ